jgi:signal transduction histidine kinase
MATNKPPNRKRRGLKFVKPKPLKLKPLVPYAVTIVWPLAAWLFGWLSFSAPANDNSTLLVIGTSLVPILLAWTRKWHPLFFLGPPVIAILAWLATPRRSADAHITAMIVFVIWLASFVVIAVAESKRSEEDEMYN